MDNILVRTAQFQPAARARRFFCFFLKAARLRAVFLRFLSRMAVSYRLGAALGGLYEPATSKRSDSGGLDHRTSAPLMAAARAGLARQASYISFDVPTTRVGILVGSVWPYRV